MATREGRRQAVQELRLCASSLGIAW
eukprot:COSAG03_NODE_13160_length_514_cov_1.110843_1_plen_25_part_01